MRHIRNNWISLALLILILIIHSCRFNNQKSGYLFSIPVEINTGNVEYFNKVIELPISIEDIYSEQFHSENKTDRTSISIFEVDKKGNILDSCVSQYDHDTLIWMMKGESPEQSIRSYNICFNTIMPPGPIENESKSIISKEELPGRWAFTTPGGYFVFEQSGGAFEVFAPVRCSDNEMGKDWVRDDYKEYNGILNIGDPNTRAIFHPNEDIEASQGIWNGCKSRIIFEGPLRYRLRSVNKFGNLPDDYRANTLYEIYFDIFPEFIRATITKGNEYGYACIMECTPGGDSLETTDFVIRSNGLKYMKGETFAEDIENEWAYIADQDEPYILYFAHKQDDMVMDGLHWYDFMKAVMLGWGRKANPGINQYPNEFYFGFRSNCEYQEMKKWINSQISSPEIEIGEIQRLMK